MIMSISQLGGFIVGLLLYIAFLEIKEKMTIRKRQKNYKETLNKNNLLNLHTCPECLNGIEVKNRDNKIEHDDHIESIQKCF